MRFIAPFFIALFLATQITAQNYPDHTSLYVNDFADLIDAETESRIDAALRAAKSERGVEATVVTIGHRQDYGDSPSFKAFAVGLFNHWGVGDAKRNDGILILVSEADRRMRIVLGDGYPPVFDDRAKTVIESHFIPFFKRDEYAKGIESGTYETLKRLQLEFDANGQVSFSSRAKNEAQYAVDNAKSGGLWAFIFGLLGLGGLGGGYVGVRRLLRLRPPKCATCQRKMRRLAEFEDDAYLSHGQQVEEALASKDYDVWYCPFDDETVIKAYKGKSKGYSACLKCSYQTVHSKREVTSKPSRTFAGKAQMYYTCKHCNHKYTKTIILPKISSRSSSGSSGGGSFGGGSSSGGGAGGSW